jgi:3-oxoadipyl-CoA thiolase
MQDRSRDILRAAQSVARENDQDAVRAMHRPGHGPLATPVVPGGQPARAVQRVVRENDPGAVHKMHRPGRGPIAAPVAQGAQIGFSPAGIVRRERIVAEALREAFVVDGVRTPIGRYGGALSGLRADDLAAIPIGALLSRHPGLDPGLLDEIAFGAANQAGEDNRNVARMAALLAGLPEGVPGITLNRLCASGMDAVAHSARAIRTGEQARAIAGGAESMSRAPFVLPKADAPFSRRAEIHDTTIGWRFVNPRIEAAHGIHSMPETADNVAAEHGISREDQDAFACRSQERWAQAAAAGRFAAEIVPVEVPQRRGPPRVVDTDEHPRPDTTRDALARLRGINGPDLTVTAGNASGVNDGAAALLIASGDAVEAEGWEPLARIAGYASAGVAPRVMGTGPVAATGKLLDRLGLGIGEIDLIELNEAFAAQALAVLRAFGIPDDAPHVNPNGGAIAMGHPLGMSGARLVLTAARELQRSGGRRALCTMCVGVGQGTAMLLERV